MDRLIRRDPSAAPLALRLLLALAVLAAPVLGAAECFFPDGTRHGEGIPCDPNASGPVTCCERTHTCLSNQLCWDTVNNQVLRESCTDKNFGGSCAARCASGGQRNKKAYLKQCFLEDSLTTFDLWACNRNATDCRSNFTLSPGTIDDRRPADESNIQFANSLEGPGSTDGGLKAGLGAGLGVGIPLLLGLLTALYFLRKAKQELARARSVPYIKATEAYTGDGSTTALGMPTNLTTYNTTTDTSAPPSSHQQQQGWYYMPTTAAPSPPHQPSPTQQHLGPQSGELRQSSSYQALSSQPSAEGFAPQAGDAPPTAGGFQYQTQELEGNGHLHEAANSNIPLSPNYDPQTKYPPMFFR